MSEFTIESISGGPFATNAYIIVDEKTKRCAVVDPGYDADRVWGRVLEENSLTLESILVTHGHIDHVCGVAALKRAFPDAPVLIHEIDLPALQGGAGAAAQFLGLPPYEPADADALLEEGKPIAVGETRFDVIFVPGHCPGHVAFYHAPHLISGDVIFAGSIGRTDLPGAHYPTLADSIVNKLLPLGDEVIVYPGHGPKTTLGRERLSNPFIQEMLAELKP